eukprot:7562227-Pyramimonas_sp.AAC.1
MLLTAVVRTALRGGKKNRKKRESETRNYAALGRRGTGSLWRSARRGAGAGSASERTREQKEAKAVELLRESLMQNACSAIAKQPPAKVTPAIV